MNVAEASLEVRELPVDVLKVLGASGRVWCDAHRGSTQRASGRLCAGSEGCGGFRTRAAAQAADLGLKGPKDEGMLS